MEFQGLFELVVNPDISVVEALRSSAPSIAFRRQLSPIESAGCTALCVKVANVNLCRAGQGVVAPFLVGKIPG